MAANHSLDDALHEALRYIKGAQEFADVHCPNLLGDLSAIKMCVDRALSPSAPARDVRDALQDAGPMVAAAFAVPPPPSTASSPSAHVALKKAMEIMVEAAMDAEAVGERVVADVLRQVSRRVAAVTPTDGEPPRTEHRCPQCGTVHPLLEVLERERDIARNDVLHLQQSYHNLQREVTEAIEQTARKCAEIVRQWRSSSYNNEVHVVADDMERAILAGDWAKDAPVDRTTKP